MIKIIVDSEKTKRSILEESKYIHDFQKSIELKGSKTPLIIGLDINKCSTLAHIYMNPYMIIVESPSPPPVPQDRIIKEGDEPTKPKNMI